MSQSKLDRNNNKSFNHQDEDISIKTGVGASGTGVVADKTTEYKKKGSGSRDGEGSATLAAIRRLL